MGEESTIRERTKIAGGSSWLDSLLLAPGIHYSQAADELAGGGGAGPVGLINAVETLQDGQSLTFAVRNTATANYIRRIARPGQTVTLDVGCLPNVRARIRLRRSGTGSHATVWSEDEMPDLGWLSHVLYLMSPVLTLVAFAFMLLLRDCAKSLTPFMCLPLTWVDRVESRLARRPDACPAAQHMGDQAAG
jgi:hypothetical protein